MKFGFCFNNIGEITQYKKSNTNNNTKRIEKVLEELDLHKIPYVIITNSYFSEDIDFKPYYSLLLVIFLVIYQYFIIIMK